MKLILLTIISIHLTSCNSFGVRRIYSPLIRSNGDGSFSVNCYTTMFDTDKGEEIEDWYEIDATDCSKVHGLSHRTFYEDLIPTLKEIQDQRDDSSL